jgi:hypothetical protein
VHASGAVYAAEGDWSIPAAQLPRFWVGLLERPRPAQADRVATPERRPEGSVVERGRRYLAAIPRPEIGCGSDTAMLYAACRLVRGFGIPAADAVELLWVWAGDRPGWTREWVERKVANALRYGDEAIGGLR